MDFKTTRIKAIYALLLATLILSGCQTATPIRTPIGPIAADHFGAMDIIGITEQTVFSYVGPFADTFLTDEITIPAGTEFAVPILSGWRLWHGDTPQGIEEMRFGQYSIGFVSPSWTYPGNPSLDITSYVPTSSIFSNGFVDTVTGIEQTYQILFLRRSEGSNVPLPPGGPAEQWRLTGEDAIFPKAFGVNNGTTPAVLEEQIRVPADTTRIISALQGYTLGFGENVGPLGPAVRLPADVDEHNVQRMEVVARVSEGEDASSRNISTELLLRDGDGSEPWYGAADFIFLSAKPEDGSPGPYFRIVGISGRKNSYQEQEGLGEPSERPGYFQESYSAWAPANADVAIPLISTLRLGYGQLLIDPQTSEMLWRLDSQPHGVSQSSIYATGMRTGPTPEFKRANFLATLGLRNNEADDDWFGTLGYTILYLELVEDE